MTLGLVDMQLITLIFTFIGVLVIGAAKWYERKIASGETWDNSKFGMFFVAAGIVMFIEYTYTGNMNFPAEDLIVPVLTLLTPIFATFGGAYSLLVGAGLFKKTVVTPVVASISATPGAVPATPVSMVPQPAGQPTPLYSTSFRMREGTLAFLKSAITDPADWTSVTAQIAAAESQNLSDYVIKWSHSRWARVQYGALMTTNGQVTFVSQIIGGAFDDSQG